MTPRNPLDDKVIIDREVLQRLLNDSKKLLSLKTTGLLGDFIWHPVTHKMAEQALAQDNTGWAATVVGSTVAMDRAAYEACGEPEDTLKAMLAACPPLGGGE